MYGDTRISWPKHGAGRHVEYVRMNFFVFFLILDTCAILRASQKKTTVEEDQCTHRNPPQKNHHLNNLLRNLGHEARPPKARRRTAAPATGKTFAQVARFTYMKVVKFVEFIKFRSVLFFVRLISASWILRCVLCVHSSSLMADGANSARRDISNRFFLWGHDPFHSRP